jgi:hypothetical protein
MPEFAPPAVQHIMCATHLFCRLRDEGMERDEAMDWARRIESAVSPIIYPKRNGGCVPPKE